MATNSGFQYMTSDVQQKITGKILCCECGVPIAPNAANACVGCIRTRVDITEGIPKQGQLYWCKFCDRYLQPPNSWISAPLESKELLAVCLKKLKSSLSKVRLVDAGFIWTEPHSKRVKVKLTVQKEVMGGAVLQQIFAVEFTQHSQMCDDCRKIEAKDYWRACVQVRQRCDHKKTLFYMEQLILRHKAHANCNGILPVNGGIDFYFAKERDAKRLVEFLTAALPCRYSKAQELVTHDSHNNTYDYKNTFSVEIVPVCKDNVVCLPKKLAQSLGNLGQICICTRISNVIHLIDPNNGQIAEVSSTQYWRSPFESLSIAKALTEYTVIDIDLLDRNNRSSKGAGQVSKRHLVAEAWLMRSSELGSANSEQFSTKTHLGHLLNPGDTAMGYELSTSNVNNVEFDKLDKSSVSDVILIKKVYDRQRRMRRRKWKLKHLNDQLLETESVENDYNEFLEDLEEDPSIRQHVNIYKNLPPIEQRTTSESDAGMEGCPEVSLQEMLDDLVIEDEEMADAE